MIVYNNQSGLTEVYLGTSNIAEVYIGSNKVFPSDVPPTNSKVYLTYNTGSEPINVECNGDSVLRIDEVKGGHSIDFLATATIGNCVTELQNQVFEQGYGLTAVTIPNTVTTIGHSAFRYCTSLPSITIPDSVTSIGSDAFSDCSGMTTCTLSSGLTKISDSLFVSCYNLTSIDIPSGVTTIEQYAFKYCRSLTSVTIPNAVRIIDKEAFYRCSGLTSVTIGSGVTNIENTAFEDCSGLTSITVNAITPPTIGYSVFDNTNDCPIYVPCESVEAYKTATRWSVYESRIQCVEPAFNGKFKAEYSGGQTYTVDCNDIDTLTSIEVKLQSSYSYTAMTSAIIGDCVEYIDEGAFSDCRSLTSVTIPNSVIYIAQNSFNYCRSLTSVTCNAIVPPRLDDKYIFDDTNDCPILVPSQSLEAYKTAKNWSTYASRIKPLSEKP